MLPPFIEEIILSVIDKEKYNIDRIKKKFNNESDRKKLKEFGIKNLTEFLN